MIDKLDCYLHSTITQDEDEKQWLKDRQAGIGGSDIGPIMGVSPYRCARDIYFTKVQTENKIEFSDDTLEKFYWGHNLEDIIAIEFTKRTGIRNVRSPGTFKGKNVSWALANVDRILLDENNNPVGILEIKTVNASQLKKWESGEVPITYIYQVQWYMYVCNLNIAYIAALVGGSKFIYYPIIRDNDLIVDMLEKVGYFWCYNVLNKIPPEIGGTERENDLINTSYPQAVDNSEIHLPECKELACQYIKLNADLKLLKNEVDKLANTIKDKLKDKENAICEGYKIKWKNQHRESIDTKKLKEENIEIYEQYKKTANFRVFSVKELNDEDL